MHGDTLDAIPRYETPTCCEDDSGKLRIFSRRIHSRYDRVFRITVCFSFLRYSLLPVPLKVP